MYVETVPNRDSRPAILLRESYREDGKIKKRTLANLSDWPAEKVEALRRALRGDVAAAPGAEPEILRSLPHGHVAAVLGTMHGLGFPALLATKASRDRTLCMAMIAARILRPGSRLATAAGYAAATATDTLSSVLGVEDVDVDELYGALDWLFRMQPHIEEKLARRHLGERCLVLYDLTSTWLEGRACPLGKLGYSRDGKKGKLQIEFGVVTDGEGRPVAVEVFEGNTSDAKTVATQVDKLRRRFKLDRVVVVGDRGMLTDARIREDLAPHGLEWVTALRAPALKQLRKTGVIQPSLFDQVDLAEIASPDFPGERLVACRNPLLAKERTRKRRELLAATETDLRQIAEQTVDRGGKLHGSAAIGIKVGAVLGRHRMKKHFDVQVTETGLTWARREDRIAAEAALDGLYVVRTNVDAKRLDANAVVTTYKQLSHVERAFRTVKTVDLEVRPIHHHLAERVRAHVLLCMLAYYVEWEMRRRLRPLLFTDEHPEQGAAERASPVAPAVRSKSARKKVADKVNAAGEPVRAFRGVLDDLATLTRNRVRTAPGAPVVEVLANPTPLQARAFELLGVTPRR
ncbi:MAG: IS1634 family transposase [Myxococcota bacterium]